MATETNAYNLLDEHWIPVLWADGGFTHVGIKEALTEAHRIRQIAASNPMDRVAILRFLLAVLVWCKNELTESDRKLLEVDADGVPGDWLKKLDEYKEKFDLLGDGQRFYQDKSILDDLLKAKQGGWDDQRKKAKSQKAPKTPRPTSLSDDDFRPIGDLLVEFPGADSVNHVRHVLHGSYGLCPACCAMGVLRFSVWASANAYYPASVNPASAVYAIAAGDNLLQTFAANLPDNAHQTTDPPWLSDSPPALPLETATAFSWRPRKLWLGDDAEKGVCANCGDHCGLIKVLAFAAGWSTPQTESQSFAKLVEQQLKKFGHRAKASKTQKAVKAAWVIRNCRLDELRKACSVELVKTFDTNLPEKQAAEFIASALDDILRKDEKAFQGLVKKPNKDEKAIIGQENLRQKKFWESDPQLLISENEALSLPRLEADGAMHARFWRSAFHAWSGRGNKQRAIAVGPVVNQFTYQDATGVSIPDVSGELRINLSGDVSDELLDLLKQVALNPDRKHPEIRSALASLTPETEARIRATLEEGTVAGDERDFLRSVFRPIIQRVQASTVRGSALHRRLILNEAWRELERLVNTKVKARRSTAGPKKGVAL